MSEMTVSEAEMATPSGTPLTDLVERASALAHRMGEARYAHFALADVWSTTDGVVSCIATIEDQELQLLKMIQQRREIRVAAEQFVARGAGHKRLLDVLLRYHHTVATTRPSWIDVMRAAERALSEVRNDT